MNNKLVDENMLLTQEAGQCILKEASVLDCECPRYLLELLQRIRDFQSYEQTCINKNDKDKQTHEWLYQAAINIDQMVSTTIIQLARIEELIDENNNIVPHKNKNVA